MTCLPTLFLRKVFSIKSLEKNFREYFSLENNIYADAKSMSIIKAKHISRMSKLIQNRPQAFYHKEKSFFTLICVK